LSDLNRIATSVREISVISRTEMTIRKYVRSCHFFQASRIRPPPGASSCWRMPVGFTVAAKVLAKRCRAILTKKQQAEWMYPSPVCTWLTPLAVLSHTVCLTQYGVQLPSLNEGVECSAFRRFGRVACPEIPHVLKCMRAPKRLTGFAKSRLRGRSRRQKSH